MGRIGLKGPVLRGDLLRHNGMTIGSAVDLRDMAKLRERQRSMGCSELLGDKVSRMAVYGSWGEGVLFQG
jgi:hypothetical protein